MLILKYDIEAIELNGSSAGLQSGSLDLVTNRIILYRPSERLNRLGLLKLELRRLRADLYDATKSFLAVSIPLHQIHW